MIIRQTAPPNTRQINYTNINRSGRLLSEFRQCSGFGQNAEDGNRAPKIILTCVESAPGRSSEFEVFMFVFGTIV